MQLKKYIYAYRKLHGDKSMYRTGLLVKVQTSASMYG